MRIDKFLVSQNICTRKEAQKLVRKGLVKIYGEIIKKPETKLDPNVNKVTVDGKDISYYSETRLVDAALQMEYLTLVVEEFQLPEEGQQLGKDGGISCTGNAEIEGVDKQWVEQCV